MDFVYEMKTGKDFETAVEDIRKALGARGFGVLWEMNFKDKLREKGLEFDVNFKVMEVCNPPKAKKVLDKDIEAGYMLPCKMAVYEKAGEVRVGMLKPISLVGLLGKEGLQDIAEEVEGILKSAILEAI
jgi:uncharacterized protein (DUF302 family)